MDVTIDQRPLFDGEYDAVVGGLTLRASVRQEETGVSGAEQIFSTLGVLLNNPWWQGKLRTALAASGSRLSWVVYIVEHIISDDVVSVTLTLNTDAVTITAPADDPVQIFLRNTAHLAMGRMTELPLEQARTWSDGSVYSLAHPSNSD